MKKEPKFTEDQQYIIDCIAAVFGGAHHLPRIQEWGTGIAFSHSGSLATYDGSTLTALVVMAHKKAIRIDIGSSGTRMVRIMAHRRKHEKAGEKLAWHERHPSPADLIQLLTP